ncbi:MAG: TRAP transporter large permease [Alphaproteobacteria bacterium]|nr:TRAP transporter large permease [Alphaproteobacteria bacterium]
MENAALVGAGFVAVFVLLFLGVPIAFGMGIVGVIGFAILVGLEPALSMAAQLTYANVYDYSYAVLPLFLLMGNFIAKSGMSQHLYDASYAYLGHRRGGLAMATIAACAGFAAVCGSSVATAATMANVAMPSMRRYGYADSLATGTIAAGGTLGILIPPSVIMVIYGLMTETDIAKLFMAGVLPGLLGALLYIVTIFLLVQFRPELGPAGERSSWSRRLATTKNIWGVLLLFLVVIGGIYTGLFTPTEAGGVGAAGAFLFALFRRALSVRIVLDVLMETAQTATAMFVLLIGALLFSNYLEVSGFPALMLDWIKGLDVAPIVIILVIMAIYIVLGCILESLSMMLLTVPIFFPVISSLGFDPVWFGILIVVVIEISLITPPIGLNVFMLKAMMPEVPIGTIFRGVGPFILADVIRLAIVVFAPAFVLFLPTHMG